MIVKNLYDGRLGEVLGTVVQNSEVVAVVGMYYGAIKLLDVKSLEVQTNVSQPTQVTKDSLELCTGMILESIIGAKLTEAQQRYLCDNITRATQLLKVVS